MTEEVMPKGVVYRVTFRDKEANAFVHRTATAKAPDDAVGSAVDGLAEQAGLDMTTEDGVAAFYERYALHQVAAESSQNKQKIDPLQD